MQFYRSCRMYITKGFKQHGHIYLTQVFCKLLKVINFNYDRCGAEASETAQSFEHKCLPACESMRHITGK